MDAVLSRELIVSVCWAEARAVAVESPDWPTSTAPVNRFGPAQNREPIDHRELEKIDRAVAGILAIIEDRMYQPVMKARMWKLDCQKAELAERMAQASADMHPNVVVRPGPERGQVDAELRGDLMGILGFTESYQDQRGGTEVRRP